ncbi:MAG: hypothetical protein NTV28_14560 [Propionibacteriales bacterium]|nr:hypothetical protein [Propionibacteriales bacterium]
MHQPRRVRHELADAAVLMAFSAGVSVALALLIGLAVTIVAGAA